MTGSTHDTKHLFLWKPPKSIPVSEKVYTGADRVFYPQNGADGSSKVK